MTTAASKTRPPVSRRKAAPQRLRALTWALHVLITCLAVFSLCTNRFHLWIDLRPLGNVAAAFTKIIWVASVLLVPWAAGPRLTSPFKKNWTNAGFSTTCARWLLWPTVFVIACLIANTVRYYQLEMSDLVQSQLEIPITLAAAVLLATWVLLTRQWMRQAARLPDKNPAPLKSRLAALAVAVASFFLVAGFFTLQLYSSPPTHPVDLAVVLGNRVKNDGDASPVLRDRTLAAVNLYKRGLVRHLLLSAGLVLPGPIGKPLRNEPLAMLKVCLDNGIPRSAISLDPYGVNTHATAFNTRNFMPRRGLKTVVACSDDFHLLRNAISFREVGLSAFTAPSIHREWPCADLYAIAREAVAIPVYYFYPAYRRPQENNMQMKSPHVVVHKAAGTLEIFDAPLPDRGQTLMRTYPCITGGNKGDKAVEGDRRTPIGTFHIVYKNPDSQYHLSLGLDYPTADDAKRGLESGLITQAQYDGILAALHSDLTLKENQSKLWYTPLGGEIFIHGHANNRTGTAGCIAVSNPDIEEIYAALPIGTPVDIRP